MFAITKIQSFHRVYSARKYYVLGREGAVAIQAVAWRYFARSRFEELALAHALEVSRMHSEASCVIQAYVRGIMQRRSYRQIVDAIVLAQSWWRAQAMRAAFNRMRSASVAVQCSIRLYLSRQELLLLQARERGAIFIQKHLRMRFCRNRFAVQWFFSPFGGSVQFMYVLARWLGRTWFNKTCF